MFNALEENAEMRVLESQIRKVGIRSGSIEKPKEEADISLEPPKEEGK